MNKAPHPMPLEQDFIPYEPATLTTGARALVLAPHPDDEVLGCGGTLALHVDMGNPVHVIILTDGSGFAKPGTDKTALRSQREQESICAARVLGYTEPEFLRFPDRGLAKQRMLVDIIAQRTRELSISHLICPSPSEIHPDHFATAMFGLETVRRNQDLELMLYEVGVPLQPNFLLDITGVWQRKQRAMECFQSQLAVQSYDRHCAGLNRFRSYTLARNVKQVEAFRCLHGTDLQNWVSIFGRSRMTDIAIGSSPGKATDTDSLPPLEMLDLQISS